MEGMATAQQKPFVLHLLSNKSINDNPTFAIYPNHTLLHRFIVSVKHTGISRGYIYFFYLRLTYLLLVLVLVFTPCTILQNHTIFDTLHVVLMFARSRFYTKVLISCPNNLFKCKQVLLLKTLDNNCHVQI